MTRTVAELAADALIANGITDLYCLPGLQLDPFFDACFHRQDALRLVHTRHEQGAAYMAMGAQVATGRPQAYAVVPGAGFLNSTGALSTAYAVHARVMAMVGQIPTGAMGKGFGVLHEIPDELAVMKSLTKTSASVGSADTALGTIGDAFKALVSGPPRPVGLGIPMNLWRSDSGAAGDLSFEGSGGPVVDDEKIADAVRLIGKAKAPLIVVGSGALDA
ncbi:MAG: thiamine pyrophosphate-binding protein, partial [Pseudomonadota bacterium]